MKKRNMISLFLVAALCIAATVFTACGGKGDDTSSFAQDGIPSTVAPSNRVSAAAHRIDVGYLSQVGAYPCGCESVSAVMALNYAGVGIGVDDFIGGYLPLSDEPYYDDDGLLSAESPNDYFIGSPYSDYSYGCYAPVIQSALEHVIADQDGADYADPYGAAVSVSDLTGTPLGELCRDYVSRDIPVIVWGTIGMQPISGETEWLLPDGSLFTWRSQEHCLLLVGYDAEYYYFNDPMEKKDTAYRKADAENAYESLYSQALAIVNK